MNISLKIDRAISEESLKQIKRNGYLTLKDYAKKHNKSERTIFRWIESKKIKAKKVKGFLLVENK